MGTVVVSVDAELGWGFHDRHEPPADRLAAARRGWVTLLSLCDEYRIPATWAIVGHLLLEECHGQHADHPTPEGWFAHERGVNEMATSLRYGPHLVEAVQDTAVDHDIGSHTFSHVEFGDEMTTRQLASAEIAASLDLAADRGIELQSFVFPRNNIGHRDVLADSGLVCYRGITPDDGVPSWSHPLGKLLRATFLHRRPPIVEPSIDEYGLVNVPASLHLFSFEGLARTLVEPVFGDPIVRQAKLGIDAVAGGDGVFHMWLHPNSLIEDRDRERVRTIFSYLDDRRSRTSLSVATMADVAAKTRAGIEQTETGPRNELP